MEKQLSLRQLCPGQRARVSALSIGGPMRRRLRDLGLVEGTAVRCVGRSPMGDPAAYEIRGAVIALRGRDSAQVWIERI